MNSKFQLFLDHHGAAIQAEWSSQVEAIIHIMMAKALKSEKVQERQAVSVLAGKMGEVVVAHHYQSLKQMFFGTEISSSVSLRARLEEFISAGVRVTFPAMINALFAGEAIFREMLLGRTPYPEGMTGYEAVTCFDEVHFCFSRMIGKYADDHCEACVSVLEKASRHVSEMVRMPSEGGES